MTILAGDNDAPLIAPEDRLRLQLTMPDGEQVLLEGRLRYPLKYDANAAPVRAGIQFKQHNDDMEDRQTLAVLTKLVGKMQRAEARRVRLGIA